jgi:acyl-CoA oxidase
LYRIRSEKLTVEPKVMIRDMGYKIACNGVDNGILAFDHVRIPVENLLNKYLDIKKTENLYPQSTQKEVDSSQLRSSGNISI